MVIQWFPGHMTKALREIQSELSRVDSVIYLLDARAPLSSLNPELDDILIGIPTLYVLNKSDLVNPKSLNKWKQYFIEKGSACIYMNSLHPKNTKYLLEELVNINKNKIDHYKKRGAKVKIIAMVVGIPNSGKSTLINNLAGKSKAKRANRPGTTRGQQLISVNNQINLIDSPGVLYPSFKEQSTAWKLSMIGSISDTIVDQIELSKKIIKVFIEHAKHDFIKRYALKIEGKSIDEIFIDIGKLRGAIIQEGEIDKERTANLIVSDYRNGLLGLICLDDVEI